MKIIVLKGQSSCGKTTTLNVVYNNMLTDGGNPTDKIQLGADKNDFSDILVYKKKKIAFFTMGDLSRPLVNAVRNYDSLKCEILVCTCNIDRTTPYKEFKKHDTVFIEKSKEIDINRYNEKNNSCAKEILNKINEKIK